MNPVAFLREKGFVIANEGPVKVLAHDGKVFNLVDLLFEYARIETEELESMLDTQIDNHLTPEVRNELLDLITKSK